MDWNTIGVISEIVGAIGILATLIYLAIQIRNNTREVKTENIHRVTDSFNQLSLMIASDKDLAELWHKGMQNYDDLNDSEKARFEFIWLAAFRIYDSLYFQIKRGTGETELWEAELKTLKWLFSAPGARSWWRQQKFAFSPGFNEFIDENILKSYESNA